MDKNYPTVLDRIKSSLIDSIVLIAVIWLVSDTLNSFLTVPMRNRIQKVIPYVAVIIGCLFILRGLGLGIPYISPSNMSLFVQSDPNCH